jgi:hypothetical protein|tara:strand:+ start:1255 stop:1431 length:177 start_codon:yes stop_codon:yes gene_type:complete
MRIVVANYGDAKITYERPYGYKRYVVEFANGIVQMYSSIWYSETQVRDSVLRQLKGDE